MNSTNTPTTKMNTPFCKICYDAGKHKNMYSSHWVKSKPGPDGVVVCPYLLSLKCRYCKGKGHTPRCCPILQKKKSMTARRGEEHDFSNVCEDFITTRTKCRVHRTMRNAPRQQARQHNANIQHNANSFGYLPNDSDTESDVSRPKITSAWLAAAEKPPVLKRQLSSIHNWNTDQDVCDDKLTSPLDYDDDMFLRDAATGKKLSWADMCESD